MKAFGLFTVILYLSIGVFNATLAFAQQVDLVRNKFVSGEKTFCVSINKVGQRPAVSFQLRFSKSIDGSIKVNGKVVYSWKSSSGFNQDYSFPNSGKYEITLQVDTPVNVDAFVIISWPPRWTEIEEITCKSESELVKIKALIEKLSDEEKLELLEWLKTKTSNHQK